MIFDGKKIITWTDLAEVFNNHYINIAEKPSGKKPRNVVRDINIGYKKITIQVIKNFWKSSKY